MEKQRIYFNDENKLVIETDNCTNINGELRTKVEGGFYIKDEDVAKLFSIVNEKNCFYSQIVIEGDWNYLNKTLKNELYIIDDNFASIIKEQSEKLVELSEKLEKLGDIVTEFNDTRHWWERKIKIEE